MEFIFYWGRQVINTWAKANNATSDKCFEVQCRLGVRGRVQCLSDDRRHQKITARHLKFLEWEEAHQTVGKVIEVHRTKWNRGKFGGEGVWTCRKGFDHKNSWQSFIFTFQNSFNSLSILFHRVFKLWIIWENFNSLFNIFKLCWYIYFSDYPSVNVDDLFYSHTVVYLIVIPNFTQNCKESSDLLYVHRESTQQVTFCLSGWALELTMVLCFWFLMH